MELRLDTDKLFLVVYTYQYLENGVVVQFNNYEQEGG